MMVYILSSPGGDITVAEHDEEEADYEIADLGMLLGIDAEDEEPVLRILPDDDDKEGSP